MHARDPVPIVMGLRLAALRATGAPLLSKGLEKSSILLTGAHPSLFNRHESSLGRHVNAASQKSLKIQV